MRAGSAEDGRSGREAGQQLSEEIAEPDLVRGGQSGQQLALQPDQVRDRRPGDGSPLGGEFHNHRAPVVRVGLPLRLYS